MTFMADDEYFLLMDSLTPTGKRYTDDDIRALIDAGIRTAVGMSWNWDHIETGFGEYTWKDLDEYVESRVRLGMKVWLLWFERAATWFPREWYVQVETPRVTNPVDGWSSYAEGRHIIGTVSPWNEEAWAYVLKNYQLVKDRYSSDQVMVCSSWLTCGETVLLNEPAWYDPAAQADFKHQTGKEAPVKGDPVTEDWLKRSYIRLMTDIQKVLIETPHRELYCALHPMIGRFIGYYGQGCNWIPDILGAYNELKPSLINHVYYTWVQWPYLWPEQDRWRVDYNERVFGGAEYCEGLQYSTPNAIAHGHRGQFIGPCDWRYGQHDHVTPWMQEQIRKATDAWRQARP